MNTNIKLTFLGSSFYLLFLVLCSAYTTQLFAARLFADNDRYRKEPISPIPLNVLCDCAEAEFGKPLFFDTRLLKNNAISCASCHQLDNGGNDNMAKDISSVASMHVINTPSIFNAQFNFRQNWDDAAASLTQQVDMVIMSHHEFNNSRNNIISILSEGNKIISAFNKIYASGITKDETHSIKKILNTLTGEYNNKQLDARL